MIWEVGTTISFLEIRKWTLEKFIKGLSCNFGIHALAPCSTHYLHSLFCYTSFLTEFWPLAFDSPFSFFSNPLYTGILFGYFLSYVTRMIVSAQMCHKSVSPILTSVNSSTSFSTSWRTFSKSMPVFSSCCYTSFFLRRSQKLFLRSALSHFSLCVYHWLESLL